MIFQEKFPNWLWKNFSFLFSFFLILTIFNISDNASAQDTEVSSRQIDEIIVTSRKTEENIQDVPIAVYAVDEKALDDFRPQQWEI